MAIVFALGIGDADASPVNLLDRTHFRLARQLGTTAGQSVNPSFTYDAIHRTMVLPVYCVGPTPSLNWQTLETKRIEAQEGSGPWGLTESNLVLYVQYDGETRVSYVDVYDIGLVPSDLYMPGVGYVLAATLTCSRYARGVPVNIGPFTVGQGGNSIWLGTIPGDAPALCTIKTTDTSIGGAILGRIRYGRFDHPLLSSGDLDGYLVPITMGPAVPAYDGSAKLGPNIPISNISVGNPTHVTTTIGHGFVTGDSVGFGSTNSTPHLDFGVQGILVVTAIDATHFTVPVTREEVIIEHVAADHDAPLTADAFQEETVDVPLYEEDVRVSKRPYLEEEVVVRTVAHSIEREGSALL